jgi:glyoxylase-like metal-dependent hydrolase (beta-lactamase superfamily II)
MKRLLLPVFAVLFAGSCATMQSPQDRISRALDAMGGPDALARVKAITVTGTMKQWEPEQNYVPGGEMRFANNLEFTLTGDFTRHAVRVDIVKKHEYIPRTFTYSEIVTPDAGWVIGVDGTSRNRQSMESNPPAHSMSGLRLAATQRELRRASPSLLLEMRRNPGKVTASPDISIGGVTYPAVSYNAGNYSFIVMFDPKTDLPARIRTLDYDNIWGDVTYDLVLSEWRTMSGVLIASSQKHELNGRVVVDTRITAATANPPMPANFFEPPAAVKAGAAKPATGGVAYQWVIRRQFVGFYLDSDHASFDTRASKGLQLNEIAPGVQHQVGGSHHTLIVEMRDFLVVMDAPVSDWQSNWTINAAKAKYPGKPVRYVVLTHHHMDHAGGIRGYAAQGATLVVGKGAGDHYRKVLAAPFTRNPDLASRDLSKTPIIEVADKYVLSDGRREVSAYLIENPHAASTLIGYVADVRIAFVTDLWNPGPPLPPKMNPGLAAVVDGVKKAGIQPVTVAGGHGSTAPYALLVGLAGGQ